MVKHKVATREEWLAARSELLAKEKELTRRGDQLAAERRGLPWVPIEKDYVFSVGAALFGYPAGYKDVPYTVSYSAPPGWIVAVALDSANASGNGRGILTFVNVSLLSPQSSR